MVCKDKAKRLLSIILIAIIVLTSTGPILADAARSQLASQLGSNEALGSPVLDDSFNTDSWNRWEMVAFGIFLSNFCTPFVDSYNTAFNSDSNDGSDGDGLQALQFGSGVDAESNEALQTMIKSCIEAQKAQLRPITVEFTTYDGLVKGTTSAPRDAKLGDLFIREAFTASNVGGARGVAPVIGGTSVVVGENSAVDDKQKGPKLDGYSLGYYNKMSIPTFKYGVQPVLDYQDGWDLQMFNAWFGVIAKNGDKTWKALEDNFDKPIYLDSFGNIVISDSGEPIVVFPASANQYITATPSYNMLNSLMLGGNYTKANGVAIKNNAKIEGVIFDPNGGAAAFLKDTEELGDGTIVMYHDTDTYMYQYLLASVKDGTAASSVDLNNGYKVGAGVSNVISSNIGTNNSRSPLKIEVIGAEDTGIFSNKTASQLAETAEIVQYLSNIFTTDESRNMLTYVTTTKGDEPLFESPVSVASFLDKDNDDSILQRDYIAFIGEYITGGTKAPVSVDVPDKAAVVSTLAQRNNLDETWKYLHYATGWENGSGGVNDKDSSNLLKAFVLTKGEHFDKKTYATEESLSGIEPESIETKGGQFSQQNMKDSVKRIINVYPSNQTIKTVSQVMGLTEGTDFSVWSTYIYYTYLNWYGVLGSDGQSNFNTAFYTNSTLLNTDGKTLFGDSFMSEEEKQAAVLDYAYLMLTPSDKGRDYRAEVTTSWINDRMIKTYKSIVFGGASYDNSNGVVSKYSNGFLSIPSYADNFMTSWLMSGYAKYAVAMIGIFFIIILLVGIITHRKFSWYIIASVLVINTLLILPSTAEITPYVANKAIQKMFSSNMTFWALSESINNEDLNTQLSGDDAEVAKYVKMLNVNYSDRSIVVNTDISRKVVPNIATQAEEIQKLQSARWLMPTLMRQFTRADAKYDYVSQPLADIFDNMEFMYWSYNSIDSASVNNYASTSFVAPANGEYVKESVSSKQASYFDNYKDTSVSGDPDYGVKVKTGDKSWKSLSREKGDEELSHTNFYMIDGLRVRGYSGTYNKDTWSNFTDGYKYGMNDQYAKEIQSMLDTMFEGTSEYIMYETPTQQYYGYLWTTENLGNYFFQTTKDTFGSSCTTQRLISELAGYYKINDETGMETRRTIMHYNDTGNIRDFLDMEELFTNVIPYMYQLELAACGTDGTNGLLGNTRIGEKYKVYSDNYQSWMFRSNWVTKLMESSEYTGGGTVRDSKGNKYTVENQMLPECYPDERPMIFSEAEMYARGLDVADLSIVEAKILDVNKAVEKKWTMLINYANTDGISAEVMYKQMALDALLTFNSEFAPDRLINSSKAMYPTTLDLRNISFDSVMKMMMIGGTRDSSYIFGDTMSGVIENGDVFTSVLLIITAILCAFIVPLITNIALGAIFYLGVWAMITNLIAGTRIKVKLSTAFIVNNIVYLIITLAYYLVFSLLVITNTADSVLSTDNIMVTVGSPTWIFLIVMLNSIVYIILSFILLSFTLKNYRDMGFEAYATIASVAASNIGNHVSKVASKFGVGAGVDSMSGSTVRKYSSSRSYSESQEMDKAENGASTHVIIDGTKQDNTSKKSRGSSESGIYIGQDDIERASWHSNDINAEIKKGKSSVEKERHTKSDKELESKINK